MEDIENLDLLGTPLIQSHDLLQMMLRFFFNTAIVWVMIHCLYYPKGRRRDYYFTFMLISISIFFLIYLLGGVKLKIGFALGLHTPLLVYLLLHSERGPQPELAGLCRTLCRGGGHDGAHGHDTAHAAQGGAYEFTCVHSSFESFSLLFTSVDGFSLSVS